MKRWFAPAALLLLTAAINYDDEGRRWWKHIEYLAADAMQGRDTGSEGHRKAAQYAASQFERLGLKPAGTQAYIQPVGFHVRKIDEAHSSVALVRDGKSEALKLGEDAMFSLRPDGPAPELDAPLVFAGYGLKIPEAHYDDLAGLDLKGKLVVYVSGGPKQIAGPLKSHYSSTGERWKALRAAGAVGIVTIQNPRNADIPWARQATARFQPAMSLADPALSETQGLALSLVLNPAHADKVLSGSGHSIAEILAAADADKPLPHFAIPARLKSKLAMKQWDVESQNVAGVLTGSDPKLRNEYVVVSAHLDHVGVGEAINGDRIYNGAMDDASGVASVLEIARLLHESMAKPRRSVLFLTVTGEEKGLLGSRYFAMHPTVDMKAVVADINLDMFLPLHALKSLEVMGLDESTLGDELREVARGANVQIRADSQPDRNLFIRSDQYNFIRRGVPALAFKFGADPGSPEEKLHKEWLRTRYHAPSDDLNQPVDKAAAAQFDRIMLALVEKVADDAAQPSWKPNSFFRRFANGR